MQCLYQSSHSPPPVSLQKETIEILWFSPLSILCLISKQTLNGLPSLKVSITHSRMKPSCWTDSSHPTICATVLWKESGTVRLALFQTDLSNQILPSVRLEHQLSFLLPLQLVNQNTGQKDKIGSQVPKKHSRHTAARLLELLQVSQLLIFYSDLTTSLRAPSHLHSTGRRLWINAQGTGH